MHWEVLLNQGLIVTSIHHNIWEQCLVKTALCPTLFHSIHICFLNTPQKYRTGSIPNVTFKGVSPSPRCLLCQIEIPRPLDAGISNYKTSPHELLKRRWKSYWDSRLKHAMVPSIKMLWWSAPDMLMFLSS